MSKKNTQCILSHRNTLTECPTFDKKGTIVLTDLFSLGKLTHSMQNYQSLRARHTTFNLKLML